MPSTTRATSPTSTPSSPASSAPDRQSTYRHVKQNLAPSNIRREAIRMYPEAASISLGNLKKCPFCRSNCHWNEDQRSLMALCICPVCGKFRLGGMSDLFLHGLLDEERSRVDRISFALRTVSQRALGKRDNANFPVYSN